MLLGGLAIGLLLNVSASAWAADEGAIATIASLDVPRYMGRWYEIAKLPNRLQKKCVGDTSAEYRQHMDGRVASVDRHVPGVSFGALGAHQVSE